MRNAGLEEAQAGLKLARRNINNLRYADDTTLMAESEEELKSLWMKVKEKSEKVGLKLNIQKTKIMASGPITSWGIDGETVETVSDFIFWAPKSLQMVIAAMKLKDAYSLEGFPGGSEVKASACNVGDLGSVPGLEGSPGEGNGNPLQYSCLENPMDGGAWWDTVHRVAKSQTRLSYFTFTLLLGRKVMTNLDSIFKSRDITLPAKVRLVKAMVFPVVMYGCESWTVKKAEC